MRTLLLQLHIDQPIECASWTHVPAMQGIQMTIYAVGGNPRVENCARECFRVLERYFRMLGGHRERAPCTGRLINFPTACNASGQRIKRVLIYVSDGTPVIDPAIATYFSVPGAVIVPIVDGSFTGQLQSMLPVAFRTQLAERTNHFQLHPIIPRILRAAGIQTKAFSLFISYVHADAAPIAGQLFHRLVQEQFDVFLDRFSSRTGDNFVSLIKEELADKAFVLVLETANIGQSKYCRQEVATATALRLGLLAVDLRGSKRVFSAPLHRCDLRTVNHQPDGTLPQNALDQLVQFVKGHYDAEISRRVRYQDKMLFNSLMTAGLNPQAIGVGQYKVNNGTQDYLVNMCRRIPALEDFIVLEELAAKQIPVETVLFGPVAAARTFRGEEINWIGQKSRIQPIDEGHLFRSVRRIAARQPL